MAARDALSGLRRVTLALACSAILVGTLLTLQGFRPRLPLGFLLLLSVLLVVAPAIGALIDALDRRATATTAPVFGLAITLTLIASWLLPYQAIVGAIAFSLVFFRPTIHGRTLAWTLVALVFGYSALSGANFLALAAVRDRLVDSWARGADMWVYRADEYRGLFPLVESPAVLFVLGTAYALFIIELVVVIYLLHRDAARLAAHLTRLFTCYAVALVVFLMVPMVGPCLAFPDSIRSAVMDSLAVGGYIRATRPEFDAVLRGLHPATTTLGYFIGLPSLHTAGAVLFQRAIHGMPVARWAFLPINVLLVASTMVLGLHYVIDIVGGLVLGLAVVRWIE